MYNAFPPYIPVTQKKADAKKTIEKLRKKNPEINPVVIMGKSIVESWWGKAWIKNLENYADYSNRIARGRSYARNGMILDLNVAKGEVYALVQGSRRKPYQISITVDPLPVCKLQQVAGFCNHRIDSMEALLMGKFTPELAEIFSAQGKGLFPEPKEIHFSCSCPDFADMCKHIAAVLYGIGARFDNDPMFFFTLRDIDFTLLLKKSVEDKIDSMLKNAGRKSDRTIDSGEIGELFGI